MKALCLGVLVCFAGNAAAERCLAIDGDTLVCQRQKVRLTNVYAAELNQAGGSAAKRKLQGLVQGREVTLKAYGHDRYGRILAEAYVDGRRIEQADIGPRAGRGSTWGAPRHVHRAVLRGPPCGPRDSVRTACKPYRTAP